MKDEGPEVFRLVWIFSKIIPPRLALWGYFNFDKSQGRVCFNCYINEKLIFFWQSHFNNMLRKTYFKMIDSTKMIQRMLFSISTCQYVLLYLLCTLNVWKKACKVSTSVLVYYCYRSGTVNLNTVNSKFHLIRSFFDFFDTFLSFHV